jgi:hypothetical protein
MSFFKNLFGKQTSEQTEAPDQAPAEEEAADPAQDTTGDDPSVKAFPTETIAPGDAEAAESSRLFVGNLASGPGDEAGDPLANFEIQTPGPDDDAPAGGGPHVKVFDATAGQQSYGDAGEQTYLAIKLENTQDDAPDGLAAEPQDETGGPAPSAGGIGAHDLADWRTNFGTSAAATAGGAEAPADVAPVGDDPAPFTGPFGGFTGGVRVAVGDVDSGDPGAGAAQDMTGDGGETTDADVDGRDFLVWQRNLGAATPQDAGIIDDGKLTGHGGPDTAPGEAVGINFTQPADPEAAAGDGSVKPAEFQPAYGGPDSQPSVENAVPAVQDTGPAAPAEDVGFHEVDSPAGGPATPGEEEGIIIIGGKPATPGEEEGIVIVGGMPESGEEEGIIVVDGKPAAPGEEEGIIIVGGGMPESGLEVDDGPSTLANLDSDTGLVPLHQSLDDLTDSAPDMDDLGHLHHAADL